MSPSEPAAIALRVVTPHRLLVEAEVASVGLPALDGDIGILPGHRPLVVALGRGELTYRFDGGEESWSVRGGHAEIRPGSVLVFTDLAGDEEDRG